MLKAVSERALPRVVVPYLTIEERKLIIFTYNKVKES